MDKRQRIALLGIAVVIAAVAVAIAVASGGGKSDTTTSSTAAANGSTAADGSSTGSTSTESTGDTSTGSTSTGSSSTPSTGSTDTGGQTPTIGGGSTTGGQPAPPDASIGGKTPSSTTVVIRVEGGQPVGGVEKIKLKKNAQVEIDVVSDTADEAHLHGYDIEKPLTPGKPAAFRFKATIEGVFELELHHAGTKLAQITVAP
jgi:hypothetical protein